MLKRSFFEGLFKDFLKWFKDIFFPLDAVKVGHLMHLIDTATALGCIQYNN